MTEVLKMVRKDIGQDKNFCINTLQTEIRICEQFFLDTLVFLRYI